MSPKATRLWRGSTSSPRTVGANYERIFKPVLSLSMGEGEIPLPLTPSHQVEDSSREGGLPLINPPVVDEATVVIYNAASEERCPLFML